jgi:SAM-dependent methyltransferase
MSFAAAEGVPVLLPKRGAPPPPMEAAGARDVLPAPVIRLLDRYRRFLRPATTYKSAAKSQVADFVKAFPSTSLIVNVGGGTRDYGPNVLNLDIEPMPGVGLVGVAERLPLADESCDGIILQAVLEHVVDENETLTECNRVLRPNGRLLVEIPFIQGDHPAPGDYRRYTEQGLRQIVERHGFRAAASGVAVGPASGLAWVLAEFLALLVSFRSRKLYRLARLGTTFVAWPVKFLDRVLDRHPMAHVIASGVWVIGTKRAPSEASARPG